MSVLQFATIDDLVGQLVLVIVFAREVFRQGCARAFDAIGQPGHEFSQREAVFHLQLDRMPEILRHFSVDARVAQDGELSCFQGQVKKDAIPLRRAVHFQFMKDVGGAIEYVLAAYIFHKQSDLAGGQSLGRPNGVEDLPVRRRLLDHYDIEIGAGLGSLAGKIWRIGLMGASSHPDSVDRVLSALGEVLGRA